MTSTLAHPVTPASRAATASDSTSVLPGNARRWLAVSRIAVGFIFLWAFLDKTFGLGFSTTPAKAWINGGTPTSGFLGHVEVGPFRTFFTSLAGSAVVDTLFMVGMLAVGLALILGIGLRIAAVAGTVIMLMMWAAEWPLAQQTFEGQPSGSNNPIVDYHLIYALVAIVAALTFAGRTWGLGRIWESTSLVKRLPWLI
jgi:thiosulfate dehydrogenase [quinone] large subunit